MDLALSHWNSKEPFQHCCHSVGSTRLSKSHCMVYSTHLNQGIWLKTKEKNSHRGVEKVMKTKCRAAVSTYFWHIQYGIDNAPNKLNIFSFRDKACVTRCHWCYLSLTSYARSSNGKESQFKPPSCFTGTCWENELICVLKKKIKTLMSQNN